MQSGPWLTAFFPAGDIDPSGTGSGTYVGGANQRPDLVGNANAGPHISAVGGSTQRLCLPRQQLRCVGSDVRRRHGSAGQRRARLCPSGASVQSPSAVLRGPGTVNLSAGLSKAVQIHERLRLRAEATFTNVINHTNLADPSLDLTSATFNTITTARGSDFGGNRTGQVSIRLEY